MQVHLNQRFAKMLIRDSKRQVRLLSHTGRSSARMDRLSKDEAAREPSRASSVRYLPGVSYAIVGPVQVRLLSHTGRSSALKTGTWLAFDGVSSIMRLFGYFT